MGLFKQKEGDKGLTLLQGLSILAVIGIVIYLVASYFQG